MNAIEQLGPALGLAALSGINLYLVVAVVGIAIRSGWLELASDYDGLLILGNPWIIGLACGLFVIEFVADKIPWLDSIWDLVHTFIRPIGGVLLALAAIGQMDPLVATGAGLVAGVATLSTHGVKSGVRALLNLSPEPISNSVASVTEDGLVLGGLSIVALSPWLALIVFTLVVISAISICFWLWKKIRQIYRMKSARLGSCDRSRSR